MSDESIVAPTAANRGDTVSGAGVSKRVESDPAIGTAVTRVLRGTGYIFQGWRTLNQHPGLLKYCIWPWLISVIAFGGVSVGFYFFYADIVNWIWSKPESWFMQGLWYLLYVFVLIVVVLMGYMVFFVLQGLLAAPFNDALSERVERLAYGQATPKPPSIAEVFGTMGSAVGHELIKLSIWIGLMIPTLLVNFVPGVGAVVSSIGGFLITARFLAYDYLDFSMARRRWRFSEKWRVLRANRALTFGFGSGVALLLLVPVFGLLCLPMAAIGGTLLLCDLDQHGHLRTKPSRAVRQ